MDEMNLTLPPELETALTGFYSAPEPDSAFAVRLESQLRQHQTQMMFTRQKSNFSFSNSKRSLMQTLRARPVLAFLAAILALIMLTGMAYAVGRLTGFIPGFGFTSNTGTVFILAEPVESSQAGITLRIDNAVSDDTRFWAALTVKGSTGRESKLQVFVLLPDGKKVQMTVGGMTSSPNGESQISYNFPALPSGTQSMTILIENLDGQNFALALRLRPVKPGEIIPIHPTENAQPQSSSQNGVSLVLDNVALASDKTILQVSLKSDRPNTWVVGRWNIRLSDQAGLAYPVLDITPATIDMGKTRIFQTSPFTGTEQLTLSLVVFPDPNVLPMFDDFSAEGLGFTFDPGNNPEVGQTWELNEIIKVGQFTIHVVRAKLTAEPGLAFEFAPSENITGAMLYTTDPLLRGSTGGVPVQEGNFTAGMTFEKIPTQPFKVVISRVNYTVTGPWQFQWQPPAAPTPAVPPITPTPSATQAPFATSTLASSDPVVLEVQQLAQKFDALFQQGPGWVHVVNETITENRQAGQTFPPPYIKSEQWNEIDTDGYILRSVWLDKDVTGKVIQQVASIANYSINFTSGDAGFNGNSKYRISFDMLTQDLNQAAQYKTLVSSENIKCEVVPVPVRGEDGSACLLVTLLDSFAQSVQNPGEAQSFSGAGRRTWINLQTGQQVRTQSFWRLQDGNERVNYTHQTVLVEKVNAPPQEILDILSRVVVP
jgi:hypothetical protein